MLMFLGGGSSNTSICLRTRHWYRDSSISSRSSDNTLQVLLLFTYACADEEAVLFVLISVAFDVLEEVVTWVCDMFAILANSGWEMVGAV